MAKLTPMIQQYLEIKEKYPDCILFYRMGDFYEMFFEDAVEASKALEITLTSRSKGVDEPVPLCGVPYHAADTYLARLIRKGYKVAICEQVEDPSQAKGIVRRCVTRVVTPGTALDPESLPEKESRYLASLTSNGKDTYGLAHLDFSTGEFRTTQLESGEDALDEIARLSPSELLLPDAFLERERLGRKLEDYLADNQGRMAVNHPAEWAFDYEQAGKTLCRHFGVENLAGFGLEGYPEAVIAAGALLQYLIDTQARGDESPAVEVGGAEPIALDRPLSHITDLVYYTSRDYMVLDECTQRNLELFRTLREGRTRGSLFGLLDSAITSMGGRLLLKWLMYPLLDPAEINRRLDAVELAVREHALRLDLRDMLSRVRDLERLASKVSTCSANARDLLAVKQSLQAVPQIRKKLEGLEPGLFREIRDNLDEMTEVVELLDRSIAEDPPAVLHEGGLIRQGFNPELDDLTAMRRDLRKYIARMESLERQHTGIPTLKVGYNKVFGYYLEVTKPHMKLVPSHYIRKQTLVNAERFITPELKEMESKVLGADERVTELNYELFCQVREESARQAPRLKSDAGLLAALDALLSLAELAARKGYSRPAVDEGDVIEIKAGRHPVIEDLNPSERFVPNDVYLDTGDHQILIITGPNMAGKSTVLRQTALVTIMAQMGSFVPADEARIGVVDRVFTRVGASDILVRGMSTFMVEMTETANILRYATPKSLILLDEIGRGTSTFDGLSIAWAVAEYLHDRPDKHARTMFATHYHELVDLAETKSRVKNYNIACKEWGDQVIFLRKLQPGGTSRSYGIQVARLAGLPQDVIDRAKEILANLEAVEYDPTGQPTLARSRRKKGPQPGPSQLGFFGAAPDPVAQELKKEIRKIDPERLTPLDALSIISKLRKKIPEE